MTDATAVERTHQDAWYARAIRERFFEREGFQRLIRWNLDRLRQALPLTSSSRVLSLGCGTGEYELLLAPGVGHLIGVDLSPIAITEARRRARERNLVNLEFREGALGDVVLEANSFDVVYALGVLHHLSLAERHALIIQVRTWLASGGWFYARDPNARGMLRRASKLWMKRSSFHSPNEEALEPDLLRHELVAAGFRDPTVGFTDVLAGPLPWLTASSSAWFWALTFAFDRAWLATPGLRPSASQFEIFASV